MKILLDTHIIIWALTGDARLTEEARQLIMPSDNMILISSASLWEIAIKNIKAPDKCPYHEKDILRFSQQAGFELLPIQPSHILALRDLKIRNGRTLSNQDPFDRILIAQAKMENALVISHDGNFLNYDERCIYSV